MKTIAVLATIFLALIFGKSFSQNSPFFIWGSGLDGVGLQKLGIYADTQNGFLLDAPKDASGNKLNISFNWRGGGTPPLFIRGSDANVGIGTITPVTKLQVIGEGTFGNSGFGMLSVGTDDGTNVWIKNPTNDRTLRLNAGIGYFDLHNNGSFNLHSNGVSKLYLGTGTLGSSAGNNTLITKFSATSGSGGNIFTNNTWLYRDANGSDWLTARLHNGISIDGSFVVPGTDTRTWWERDPSNDIQSFGTGNAAYITINTGNVGIGTTTPDAKLAVKGHIHTQEVRVDLTGAVTPDYVFEKDYDLLSLSELETYITQNKHLPEVPSAREMEANGLNLKEMNLLLLKKVEELTVHLIELKKEVTELRKK